MAKRLLWTLREGRHLDGETWDDFKAQVLAAGYSPDAALSRLIRRYLNHGFEDGEPERSEATEQ
ncbi:MAG TPA: hypothetical protein VM364_05855 [Vicinamibacterales bacterium]|nr:hypothetical protein [Vicinamibacterales bacterium]